jgi:hypothetical protein
MAEMDFLCSGRQKCEVRIPDLGTVLELRMACLEELKNYMEAAYKCVKGIIIIKIGLIIIRSQGKGLHMRYTGWFRKEITVFGSLISLPGLATKLTRICRK